MRIGEKVKINVLDENNVVVHTLKFETVKSGAFQYGNQTSTIVTMDDTIDESIDTRYFIGDMIDFLQWYRDHRLSKKYRLAWIDNK